MAHHADKLKNYDFFLWEQFKRGDKSALQKIYYAHYQGMLDYGLRFTDERDFVREKIQQVYRDLIVNMDELGKTGNIRFYLLWSLRQQILTPGKKQAKKTNRARHARIEGFDFRYYQTSILPEKSNGKGLPSDIRRTMARLTNQEREALYLKFHQRLDEIEIDRMLEVTGLSARQLIYQALEKLPAREKTHQDKNSRV